MPLHEEQLVYVYFDGAQAEARIVAYEANIPKWKEQFERARLNPGSYDAHRALAVEMYHVKYEDLSPDDYYDENTVDCGERMSDKHTKGSLTYRGKAKRCRHGLNYRMQPERLAATSGMSITEARASFDAYHRATPELRRWWDEVINEVRTTRKLYTCLGRRMEFLGSRVDEDLLDSIIAFKPQSTLGDLVTSVQYLAQEDDDWPAYARIPFNDHDSLTALCRERDAVRVAMVMKKYAERPLIIKGEQLIIPADFKISVPDEKGYHRKSGMKKFKF